jgi:hypothetical protein
MNKITRQIFKLFVAALSLITSNTIWAQKSEADLKKEAARYFDQEDFTRAYPLYSQLLSLYQQDPEYNYRFGACMLFFQADKAKPVDYLEFAVKKPSIEPLAYYYLGRAYHLNYRFDDAIKAYQHFKQTASGADVKKHQVDHLIEMCENGKTLLKDVHDLDVLVKKELSVSDYFHAYDLHANGGSMLIEPDDFKSKLDKKKGLSSVMYLSPDNMIFFASYGDDDQNGKDIYMVKRVPGGGFSKPQNLGTLVNTPYDEDFPFYDSPTHTLYFCSKGHNSMGGYDIFKSVYNPGFGTWSTPVNMDFPINTPDDDILFIADTMGKTAYFASTRTSPGGMIDIYKINIQHHAPENVLLAGITYADNGKKPIGSTITVKVYRNGNTVGVFNSSHDSGTYFMSLPNDEQLVYTLETPGHRTQSTEVLIPKEEDLVTLKQVIGYDTNTDKLIVTNHFETEKANQDYLLALDYIRRKAKMEVNIDTTYQSPTVADNTPVNLPDESDHRAGSYNKALPSNNGANPTQPTNSSTNGIAATQTPNNNNAGSTVNNSNGAQNQTKSNNSAVAQNSASANSANNNSTSLNGNVSGSSGTGGDSSIATNGSISNTQLAQVAASDAQQYQALAQTATDEANKATDYASEKFMDAQNMNNEAKTITYNASSITNSKQKEDSLSKAAAVKQQAADLSKKAIEAFQVAAQEQADAKIKQKQADQAVQYSQNLDSALKTKNKQQAIANLTAQQENLKKQQAAAEVNTPITAGDVIREQAQNTKKDSTQVAQHIAKLEQEINSLQQQSEDYVNKAQKTDNQQEKLALLQQAKDLADSKKVKEEEIEDNKKLEQQLHDVYASQMNEAKLADSINGINPTATAVQNVTPTESASIKQEIATYTPPAKNVAIASSMAKINASNNVVNGNGSSSNNQTTGTFSANNQQQVATNNHSQSAATDTGNSKRNSQIAINNNPQTAQHSNSQNTASTQTGNNSNATDLSTSQTAQSVNLTNNIGVQNSSSGQTASTVANQNVPIQGNTQTNNSNLSNQTQSQTQTNGIIQDNVTGNVVTPQGLVTYSDPGAAQANRTSQSYSNIADTLSIEANTFREKVSRTSDKDQARMLSQKADSLDNLSQQKKLQSIDASNMASANQFMANKRQITAWQNAPQNGSTDQTTTADLLLQDANFYYNKSLVEKQKADSTNKPYLKQSYLDNASNYLSTALVKQQSAERIYLKSNPKLASVRPVQTLPPDNQLYGQQSNNILALNNQTQASQQNQAGNTNPLNASNTTNLTSTSQITNSSQNLTDLNSSQANPNNSQSSGQINQTNPTDLNGNHQSNLISNGSSSNNSSASNINTSGTTNNTGLTNNNQTSGTNSANSNQNNNTTITQSQVDNSIVTHNSVTDISDNTTTLIPAGTTPPRNTSRNSNNDANNNSTQTTTNQTNNTAIQNSNTTSTNSQIAQKTATNSSNSTSNGTEANPNIAGATNGTTANNTSTQSASKIDSILSTDNRSSNTNSSSANNNAANNQAANTSGNLQQQNSTGTSSVAATNTSNTPTSSQTINSNAVNASTINHINNGAATSQNTVTTTNPNNLSTDIETANTTSAKLRPRVTVDVFTEVTGAPYSAKKPIPIDEPLPEGLVYKVQIGAFRNVIRQNLFKGIQPISGERTGTGLTRYMAGEFKELGSAKNAQARIKELGYKDAFIVAFYNGKRININQASGVEGGNTSAASTEINPAQNPTTTGNTTVQSPPVTDNTQNLSAGTTTTTVNNMKGVFYSVQIGAFTHPVPNSKLYNLRPIFSFNAPNGYIRYNCGIYNNASLASIAKHEVLVKTPIHDAFIVAYHDGERITVDQATQLLNSGATSPKDPNLNVMPNGSASTAPINNTTEPAQVAPQPTNNEITLPTGTNTTDLTANPGSNTTPAPVTDTSKKGVSFCVQVGAFSGAIPIDMANKLLQISSQGIKAHKETNGMTAYTLGDYPSYTSADLLKQELVKDGYTQSFIVAYYQGKKISLQQAQLLINK